MPTIFFTLYFDSELEDGIRRVQDCILRSGIEGEYIPDHRPHITLAAYDVDDVESFDQRLAMIARERTSFTIRLHHVGMFPEKSVVFLAPRHLPALYELHRAIVHEFSTNGDSIKYEHLAIENWVPHCTLAWNVPRGHIGMLFEAVQENWKAMCGTANGVGILVPPDTQDRQQFAFRTNGNRVEK